MKKQAGKGDKARNCFSKAFKDNYDSIRWTKKNTTETNSKHVVKDK